jgi:hypothetical protein
MTQISVTDTVAHPGLEPLQLVELISEGMAALPQAEEASRDLTSDLAARLVDFERDPHAGYEWDQVKAKLKNGSWRTA